MATLLTCRDVGKAFGVRTLFEGLSISFADGERIGFFGPNGAGKTTFLKILAGLEEYDAGEINTRRDARIAYLPQEDSFEPGATVRSVLEQAAAVAADAAHECEAQISVTLARFNFRDPNAPADTLSGGWRKRLALAREIIKQPDLLLMDEPTNHLDLEGIVWLEDYLSNAPFAFLAVSHDRYFMERVSNRVVELNPIYLDGYFSSEGSYSMFLDKRADFLEAQQARQTTLSNLVRQEVAFLRSHAKARRSKSKSRIDEAYRLKGELAEMQERTGRSTTAEIDFAGTGRRTRKLIEADEISKSFGDRLLFKDVSILLSPGSRVGLLGGNGSGKTTLIRVLTGDLESDSGRVRHAEDLRVVVFDQTRESLPRDVTLAHALSAESEFVDFRGRSIHVAGWAQRFLFRHEQLSMPVGELSGGEQARILIARLMLQPADVLILDEPTNDLDIASLDVLEESLNDFPGALVLVTHDRFMLDRICSEMLGLDGEGRVGRYGQSEQWLDAVAQRAKKREPANEKSKAKTSKPRNRGGLSSSERKELNTMEKTILEAEQEVERRRQALEELTDASDHVETEKRWAEVETAKRRVEELYARWEELDAKAE